MVLHIQDVDGRKHYEVSLISVPETLPSYAHTQFFIQVMTVKEQRNKKIKKNCQDFTTSF